MLRFGLVVPREDLALAVERACKVPVLVLRFGLAVPREDLAHVTWLWLWREPARYQYTC
jgi:hypothetical protein